MVWPMLVLLSESAGSIVAFTFAPAQATSAQQTTQNYGLALECGLWLRGSAECHVLGKVLR